MAARRQYFPGRVTVAIVGVIALVATALLLRTERNAAQIHTRTARIASSARGINSYTDSILELTKTNDHASAILNSVGPLTEPLAHIDGRSAEISELLKAIRSSTASIDTSAGSIDSSGRIIKDGLVDINAQAGKISTDLRGINNDAGRILTELAHIRSGLNLINTDLPTTARILDAILRDARNILNTLGRTEHYSACIDNGLNGNSPCDATGTSR
jgi:hypothetical protein